MLESPIYLRESTEMDVDPVSDLLKLTDAQSVVSGGFTAGDRWALRFSPPDKLKFFAVVRGHCLLLIEGERQPLRIEAGDAFLLSAPRGFVLSSEHDVLPQDATQVFAARPGAVVALGQGDEFFLLGGHVQLDAARGGLLSHVLPPLIHVRADAPQATVLHWLLAQLVHEREAALPGASVATAQLAQLMFVQLLRVHLTAATPLKAGFLRAMSDARIAPALRLLHGEPGRDFCLEELARAAAMSRTTFATYFKRVAGITPLAYLTEWRMRLAERALREEDTPIAALAQTLGYTSESAFSHAFKRVTGIAPRTYRGTLVRPQDSANRGGPPRRPAV